MDIHSCFPSNYLRAADLPANRDVRAVMDAVEVETMQDGADRPVLRFQNKARGLVLNKCNAATIAAAYGPETDNWAGRAIILFVSSTMFQGRQVACIRCRATTGGAPRPTAPPPPEPELDPFDIPF